jgi:hypothetical protein
MNEYFKAGFEKIALRDIEMTRNTQGTFVPRTNAVVPRTPSGSAGRKPPKVVPPKAPKINKFKMPKFKGKLGLVAGIGGALYGGAKFLQD